MDWTFEEAMKEYDRLAICINRRLCKERKQTKCSPDSVIISEGKNQSDDYSDDYLSHLSKTADFRNANIVA